MIYSDQLYAFVLRLTKSPIEAEDILQETFLRIWNNRSTISQDASFKSYLFKISYHQVIDRFRKQVVSIDFEDYISSEHYRHEEESEIEQQLSFDDFRRLIDKSLARLTPRQQKIFRLSREEECSSRDIGELLGITEKTVNNQLSIILSHLKKDLVPFLLYMFFNM